MIGTGQSEGATVPDFAFYYPGHLWYSPAWLKNLLLFFDGIALLVPEYKIHEPTRLDPEISNPLLDRGLLRLLRAESIVDAEATNRLAIAMAEIIGSGGLDYLSNERTEFHRLSYSRIGGYGDSQVADAILAELQRRGLAEPRGEELSVGVHPMVRVLVLVLLSQILRTHGRRYGMELAPATDQPKIVSALGELVSAGIPNSSGAIVSFDLEAVGVDLELVPLDEVLDYRKQHLAAYRQYARSVRKFAREISSLTDEERREAFRDRSEEIKDMAAELARHASKAWRKPTTFSLSLAGAGASYIAGNIAGALFAATNAVIGTRQSASVDLGPYSYLFATKQ